MIRVRDGLYEVKKRFDHRKRRKYLFIDASIMLQKIRKLLILTILHFYEKSITKVPESKAH